MGTIDILSNATTALLQTQQQIGIVSQNVSNANSDNYTLRNASTVEQSPDAGGGVSKVVVQRAVNTALQTSTLNQTSLSGQKSYISDVYTQLENLTQSSSGTPLLSDSVQSLVSAFQAYQTSPESQSAETGVVNAATGLVNSIQTISTGIVQIQTQTQKDVQSDLGSLNTDLKQLDALNKSIVSQANSGNDTSDLEDQRDAVLSQISQFLPIRQQANSDGSISLYTPTGVSLVGANAAQFSYDAATNTIYPASDPNKTSLNSSFSSGRLGAEVNILRTDATAVQSKDPGMAPLEKARQQLNALADQLYAAPPATPTALQSAYDSATPANTGELASSLFTFSSTPPSTVNDDRDYIAVNPSLLNGTARVKQAAAQPFLAQLTATTNNFAGGNVTVTNASFTQIATAIASDQSGRASQAQTDSTSAATSLSTVTQSYKSQTGVSVDQQLSKLIVLQNAYSAAAKIISTVDQLQQTLLSSVS